MFTPLFLTGMGKLLSNIMTGIKLCKKFLNEEFLVITSHHLVLITSLPFVHTARRSYRLNEEMNLMDSDLYVVRCLYSGKLAESLCL